MDKAADHFLRSREILPNHFEAPIFLMQLHGDPGREEEAQEVGTVGFDRAEQNSVFAQRTSGPDISAPRA
ncbi:MAG TPA: hypothetical protein VEB69_14710 [Acidimicrobiia bacterium]|nr:hypothetical protein [Acidimicrobiia bacterium]